MTTAPCTSARTPAAASRDVCWHSLPPDAIRTRLGVDPASGLNDEVARSRFLVFGPNRLSPRKQEKVWDIFLKELREPMIVLLLITGVLYAIWGELGDTLTIFVVILTLITAEVLNERRAQQAIGALIKLSEPTSPVIRSGQYREVPAEQIVPGDLIENLRKGVRYYLACKAALISIALLPVLLGLPIPFAPIQIILMELFMDLAASAAFVAEPAEAGLMRRPPHDPKARFLDRSVVRSILISATGLFAAVCGVYVATWHSDAGLITAQTMAFATWLLGHVFLALNLRTEREPLFRVGLFSNRVMVVWAIATFALLLVATLFPGAQHLIKLTSLRAAQWALAAGAAFAGTFWMEVRKLIYETRTGKSRESGKT
jgi:magnesium-transporting ATPase (P-type)